MPEVVNCALCGGNTTKELFVGHDLLYGIPGEYHVVQCTKCSLVYINPRPARNEIAVFYPATYADHTPQAIRSNGFLNRLVRDRGLQTKRKLVQKFAAGGTLLDVGCATGDFLREMSRERKWNLLGVELNSEAARCAMSAIDAQITCADFDEVSYLPNSLDVVTMWHVLEHMPDPKSALNKIRSALKPVGVLIIAVPLLDSLNARWFGPYWAGYDVPRHLYTYSKSTLAALLTSSGFDSIYWEPFIGGYDDFRISMIAWAEDKLKSHQGILNFIRGFSQSIFLRLLMWPYLAGTYMLGRGATIVIARSAPAFKPTSA